MIVVTGGAGFIGSNIVAELAARGHKDVLIVDTFGKDERWRNLVWEPRFSWATPDELPEIIENDEVGAVIHMGAISSTEETDVGALLRANVESAVEIFDVCARHNVPFIWASSASVYGASHLFSDGNTIESMSSLRPLNAYGFSKLVLDRCIAARVESGRGPIPPQWVGLRFFNVYGPGERHKGRQASVVTKWLSDESARIFNDHRDPPRRDFVYVKDCARLACDLIDRPEIKGIFNVGTGVARSFEDVAKVAGMTVEYVDFPPLLRARYQYFTEADTTKLTAMGLWKPMSIEKGIADYYGRHPDGYL